MLNGLFALIAITGSTRDSLPRLDTAFVEARRLKFASLGHFQQWVKSDEATSGNLANYLSTQGVFFKQYGWNGISTLGRRGAEPQQTQVLWNGLPVSNAMLGMVDFNNIPAAGFKDIILTDGGNATLYGSGSVGGTLQLNNGKPADSGLNFLQNFGYGSFSRFYSFTDLGLRKSNFWVRSQVTVNRAENNFLYRDLEANQWLNKHMHNAASGILNGRLMAGQNLGRTELTVVGEAGKNYRELGMSLGSEISLGTQWDKNLKLVINSNSRLKNIQWINRVGYTFDKIIFRDAVSDLKDTSLVSVKHVQSEIYFSKGKLHGLTGGDLQVQQGFTKYYTSSVPRIYPAQFFTLTWLKSKMQINFSSRFEWYEKIPVFSVAGEYKINKIFGIFSNLHNTFRRPTLNDIFWQTGAKSDLKSETGFGGEFGFRSVFHTEKFDWNSAIAIYSRMLKNGILWMPDGALWRPVNYLNGKYQGLDIQAGCSFKLVKTVFGIQGNYHFVKSQVLYNSYSDEYRSRIFIPSHTGNLEVSIKGKKWFYSANLSGISKRFITTDNSDFVPGYLLINSQAGYQIRPGKKCQVNISIIAENLTNAEYVNMPSRPMPGRSIMLNTAIKILK